MQPEIDGYYRFFSDPAGSLRYITGYYRWFTGFSRSVFGFYRFFAVVDWLHGISGFDTVVNTCTEAETVIKFGPPAKHPCLEELVFLGRCQPLIRRFIGF